MSSIKVTLRKREYPSGKVSLYLDFYPAIKNPRTGEESRREYLGIYIMKSPRTPYERKINAAKMKQAEAIRAQRELSLINDQYGFIDKGKFKTSALEYFESLLPAHDKKWLIVYEHFKLHTKGKCTFGDLTVDLCNGFRDYLLSAKRIKSKTLKISQNSASSYWSTFRAFLAQAYKEGYLKENINDNLDKIEAKETRREYLTMDELKKLYNTPCDPPFSPVLPACESPISYSSNGKTYATSPTEANASVSALKRPKPKPQSPSAKKPLNSAEHPAQASSSKI